ncbi:MAG TPA: hypothetical protein VJW20_01310 [Candidatus Angelobacter sp.]|nr:hypothetical protein [Candidatus Angelobacter sp.]
MNGNEAEEEQMNENEAEEEQIQESISTREIKPRDPQDPLATATYKGQFYTREEVNELIQRENDALVEEENREYWEQSEAGQLCIEFYEAFRAYEKYIQENPHAIFKYSGDRVDYSEHKAFEDALKALDQDRSKREETARKNLEKAQRAARCQHTYVNGDRCGAPRVRGRKLCYMHERMEQTKAEKLDVDLGPMEDPDSIQMGIKRLQAAIIDGKLDSKQIGQLAYTIQLAAWNVTRTSMMAKT